MSIPLPQTGLLRLSQILGSPETKHRAALPALIPVSRSTWYEGVRNGRYPKPVKLGANAAAYRVEDIRRLIDHGAAEPGQQA
ncbi:helix-turn-helix transcriptional regulator [Luteimonas changyuni]|uniref:helix-turn-helix transcriptional regulator n=1 Tax=Luteimonas sp. MJ145 TaxID=3129234 RepID=UPI0031BABA63